MRIIKLILLLLFFLSFQCCQYRVNLPDNFDALDVILINSEKKQNILIIDEESKNKIYASLKMSNFIIKFKVIKEALKEGVYLIKVKNGDIVYKFTLINTENIYNHENEKFYKNTELIKILRNFI